MRCSENEIIESYTNLVKSCVSKYIRYDIIDISKNNTIYSYEDLLQEAFITLILSYRCYSDTHNCSFSTWAYICINNRLRKIKHRISYNANTDELKEKCIINIDEFLPDDLSILEKEIIYFRLYNYTFGEIANYYELKLHNIKSKYRRIIKKIRRANKV